ncbi:hypothetical protein BDP27DRAFT_1416691 [Rhodocollybia butyracea]|uniref:Uncharacterized protein n=1 Tax=Rhodocollybia butyracea TaxID=206335 RepID=A0A9P5Q1Y6_9AGAR|nr:hypothetical protein BDP27DRAFT_1416691 [Rhodocollybia butyracea]
MLPHQPGAWRVLFATFFILSDANKALASSKQPQVTWVSPSAGDIYGPGDSILGKWTCDSPVVSPAFELCPGQPESTLSKRSGGDDSTNICGDKVYPTVQQSKGTYEIMLAVPNTTTEQEWYLKMTDDFENIWSSPSFSLSPNGAPSIASAAFAQAPLSAPSQTTTPMSGSTLSTPVTAVPVPVMDPESAPSTASMNTYATRKPPPTAAFAVPLSVVGAILLVAVFLSLRHNRKLAEERAQDIEKLVPSRTSSITSSFKSGFSRQSDIEHALNVLSKANSQGDVRAMPVPLFMPVDISVRGEARRNTRESYQPNQYTEYSRSGKRFYQEKPPSYRTNPVSTVSRSESRARSLLSSFSSRPSSHTALYSPSSHHQLPSLQLPSLRLGSPLCHFDHDNHRNQRPPRSPHREDTTDVECATHSVLDDYLFSDAPKNQTLPALPDPPQCLMPAPQRLHVRNSGAVSPRSCSIPEEKEPQLGINPYDAVTESLNRARI